VSTRSSVAPGSAAARCWARWTGPPSGSGWPPPPATSPTPASAGSPWAAGWAGWPAATGWPATTSPASSWSPPTARSWTSASRSTPSCIGDCAAAAGTSAWSPSSSFACTRSAPKRCWSSCSTPPTRPPGPLQRWRELLAEAPRQATLTAWAGTTGHWPFLPAALWGRPLASVGYVWVGDPDHGRGLLDALCGQPPAAQRVQALPYLELQRLEDDQQGHHLRRYWKGHYLRQLGDDAITAFLGRGHSDGGDPGLLPAGSLQSYRGAIAEAGDDQSAFGHRDALVEFIAAARWTDPAQDQARIAAARRYGAAVEPFASGVYVNDLTDEGQVGVQRAYGQAKLARLAALKARYDPDNTFHLNHNIQPATP
jgi:FAD/FMN-containing dehydrogenase